MTPQPIPLRSRAEGLAAHLPPLLAEAQHLAASVILGEHGRRRPGLGDAFWQYRPAIQGDSARAIDWRRSARSDQHFVQEKEWQATQTVMFWVDRAMSMQFSSAADVPRKADRAAVLALAAAVLLVRGGERVGLTNMSGAPQAGRLQLDRLARALEAENHAEDSAEYGTPDANLLPAHARAVFISDFMGDMAGVRSALTKAADRGVKGVLMQVLDPVEEAFPFQGRMIFESMKATLRHESRMAGALRDQYQERLGARKDALWSLAQSVGWQYHCHHTDDTPAPAFLWLYHALERPR